jgi:DHA2 family multidrug resistance protein
MLRLGAFAGRAAATGGPVLRGPITVGIMLATTMNALDLTIVNVSLPHMQGNLSASPEQITWVLTAYMIATAVMTPVSGWLASRFGIRRMLLATIAGFTMASVLCGMATNLTEMVLFRMLQGITAAPMTPLAQAVLLNINPPSRHARTMALFTMSIVVAPVVGPVVGGWLTEDYSWRWCFFINIPAGLGALVLLWLFLPREPQQCRPFDFLGFASLAITLASFQLMLDRGTTKDWFSSPEICIEAGIAATAFAMYLAHTLTAAHPLFPNSMFRDRNFVTSTVFSFFFSVLLFCSFSILPLMMQDLLRYPAIHSGILSAPRGMVMLAVLVVMGRIEPLVDRRLLVGVGSAFIVWGFWEMAKFDLSMSGNRIVFATILQGIGQGIIFVPLTTLGFSTIPQHLRPDASAISNLSRNIGGSIGIAAIQALTVVNTQTMHASLAAHVIPENPFMGTFLPPGLSPDTVAGAIALNAEITRQARMVAYVNDFWVLTGIALLLLPLVMLLRKPRDQRGGTQEPIVEVGA